MNRRLYWSFALLVVSLVLVGCNPKPEHTETEVAPLVTVPQRMLDGEDKLLALRDKNTMVLLDPETKETATVYVFKPGELPLRNDLHQLQVSPSKRYVVWHTPDAGLLAYDLREQQVISVESASAWLAAHPYFEFGSEQDELFYVTEDGETLNRYTLDERKKTEILIPYPFGFEFRVAPDGNRVVYVTGYGENPDRPKFMFTELGSDSVTRFSEETELVDRYAVVWAPDSSGILTIKDGGMWLFPFTNPTNPELVFESPTGRITDIYRFNNLVFIEDNAKYWQVYDYDEGKRIAQTPSEIIAEIRRPTMYPWVNQQFLVSELIVNDEETFSRLWLTDFRGIKEVVYEEYGQLMVDQDSVQLD